ncbi:MAG: ABC transporter permease [Liquorilactobacillus hordei]|uniref:ABC transporter permease n=2 Tax=Liquorilactobacillus hordei TaxID=468911 RepID=UPI0039E8C2BD
MNEIWNGRLKKYQKMLLRYSKYVFNDHFVLALLFFVGGLGLSYSNFVKSLPQKPFWWEQPILIIILFLIVQIGKLASLLEEADKVFLLPKDYQMKDYFKLVLKHSALVSFFTQLVFMAILAPFIIQGLKWQFWMWIVLLIVQCLLKFSYLSFLVIGTYNLAAKSFSQQFLFHAAVMLILVLSLYLNVILGVILAIVLAGIIRYYVDKVSQQHVFKWNDAIKSEKERLMTLYRFINMFTDVPQIVGQTKRRKFFDFLLRRTSKNVYLFLYSRSFVRQSGFSGLFLRLLFLASIIVFFSPNYLFSLFIICVCLYLIGIQLFGLYSIFEDNVFVHIYPVDESQKKLAFKNLLQKILLSAWLVTNVVAVATPRFEINYLLLPVISLAEVYLITNLFLGNYLKKNT